MYQFEQGTQKRGVQTPIKNHVILYHGELLQLKLGFFKMKHATTRFRTSLPDHSQHCTTNYEWEKTFY